MFKLISSTAHPLETIYAAWTIAKPTIPENRAFYAYTHGMRGAHVPTALDVLDALEDGAVSVKQLSDTFKMACQNDFPLTEAIHFTWAFSEMPISWREQAVRERHWGFWVQSMRMEPLEKFYDESMFRAPTDEAFQLCTKPLAARIAFDKTMHKIQECYKELRAYDMKHEDARSVIPLAGTHGGSMFSTLRTLLHTLDKRACWILQRDLWGPVVEEMERELENIDPVFKGIVTPPCFKRFSNDWKGCPYAHFNELRMKGEEPWEPCPCWMEREHYLKQGETYSAPEYVASAKEDRKYFESLWNRDMPTGYLRP